MLQILSTSNETSTGTELVQNGNFSELGSDLVTNGDFSAAGINLVSNPNFTDTGSELVTDGDFSSGANWYEGTGCSISGNQGVFTSAPSGSGFTGDNLNAAICVIGKSYKVTYTIDSITSGSVGLRHPFTGTYYDNTSSFPLDVTEYVVADNTSIYIQNSGTTTATISNVSVKELGEDWTVTEDTGSVTFANDQVQIISDGSAATGIIQGSILSIEKSYKVTIDVASNTNKFKIILGGGSIEVTGTGVQTFYGVGAGTALYIYRVVGEAVDVVINSISVQELGEGWTAYTSGTSTVEYNSSGANLLIDSAANGGSNVGVYQENIFELGKSYKIVLSMKATASFDAEVVESNLAATENVIGTVSLTTSFQDFTFYYVGTGTFDLFIHRLYNGGGASQTISIQSVSVQELDPNGYWTLGTGWSIGADKAISTVTGSNSDITQSILTAGKTYRTVYEIVDYTAGTAQAIVTGSDGADAVALGTYTEDLTTTGTDFSIRSKLGTFDGAVSSVSVKQLGTYEEQSIYVTAADVQTIPQASVYYLVELTSMGSKNSLYFIPSSIVPNNGRYTKLNFTVISKDALPQPTVGIISFYDSVGGLDTYPMGFYEFRIYEQTSSTNLDPLLATGLLEKGFAFVRDFSGNMQELTDGFKEYNPALTQYVYSK